MKRYKCTNSFTSSTGTYFGYGKIIYQKQYESLKYSEKQNFVNYIEIEKPVPVFKDVPISNPAQGIELKYINPEVTPDSYIGKVFTSSYQYDNFYEEAFNKINSYADSKVTITTGSIGEVCTDSKF